MKMVPADVLKRHEIVRPGDQVWVDGKTLVVSKSWSDEGFVFFETNGSDLVHKMSPEDAKNAVKIRHEDLISSLTRDLRFQESMLTAALHGQLPVNVSFQLAQNLAAVQRALISKGARIVPLSNGGYGEGE